MRRFDESRGTLEYLYTPNALFSLKLDPTVPARHRRAAPPFPFEPRWLMAANRLSSTPVAITNAIRALPPGSHDLSRCHYTARTVPELHLRKQQPLAPIVVHLVGEFEEFPDKTVRGFGRTFIIVPRGAGSGTGPSAAAGGGAAEYWIHSDQLTMRYHVPGEPRALPIAASPFVSGPAPAPLASRPAAPPRVDSAASASGAAARPFAQLQPHPGLARLQAAAPPPAPVAAALAPAPAPIQPARPAAADAAPPPPAPPAAARAPPQPAQPQKRRRASSASPGPLRPASLAAAASSSDVDDDGDVDMSRNVLVLTDSSAGSRSPTPQPSPVKAAAAPLQRKRRAASPAPRSGLESASGSGSGSKRRVSGPSTPPGGGATAAPSAVAAAEAGLSRAEVERLIQLEVAAQVQRLTANAGRAVSPRSDAEAAEPSSSGSRSAAAAAAALSAASATAGKKRTKERTAERARELLREREREDEAKRAKDKERKDKERKDKERKEKERREKEKESELGTGLGKTDARILIPGGGNAQLHGASSLLLLLLPPSLHELMLESPCRLRRPQQQAAPHGRHGLVPPRRLARRRHRRVLVPVDLARVDRAQAPHEQGRQVPRRRLCLVRHQGDAPRRVPRRPRRQGLHEAGAPSHPVPSRGDACASPFLSSESSADEQR